MSSLCRIYSFVQYDRSKRKGSGIHLRTQNDGKSKPRTKRFHSIRQMKNQRQTNDFIRIRHKVNKRGELVKYDFKLKSKEV